MTAVELLPIHHIVDESFLLDKGLTNYWGYSSIGYFAPHAAYAATGQHGEQVREFKGMVKALHRAGHRGDPRRRLQPHRRGQPPRADAVVQGRRQPHVLPARAGGPALLHGLHRHGQHARRRASRRVLRLHHGLAALLRSPSATSTASASTSPARWRASCTTSTALSAFFDTIHQDPILSQVKLIAEPWDVGPGGYQVGNFPVLWSEWNGMYRDTMRDFWRGETGVAEFAHALQRLAPTSTRPTAATRSRRSTSSPRTTASRCATSSRTTRSTTTPTARTTATGPTTTAPGTAASRARPTTRRSRAAPPPAAQHADDAGAVAGRADAARRRRARAARRAATTTPGARTTRSPGTTGACWRTAESRSRSRAG